METSLDVLLGASFILLLVVVTCACVVLVAVCEVSFSLSVLMLFYVSLCDVLELREFSLCWKYWYVFH